MSDGPTPSAEKEYWHDKRLATPPPRIAPEPQHPAASVAPAVVKTFRNLRHPLVSFVVTVLVVILVGVALLTATGGGALPVPTIPLANCAPPTADVLGAHGAQFTADFPVGVKAPLLGPAANDYCSYVYSAIDGDFARPLALVVTATSGQVHVPGWGGGEGIDRVPYWWVIPSELRHVSLDGASGLEAFRCEKATDWCYGWLRVSLGRVTWVVNATGNGARLSTLKAFMLSFRPVR